MCEYKQHADLFSDDISVIEQHFINVLNKFYETPDEGCWNPLQYAKHKNRTNIVDYFISKGADTNIDLPSKIGDVVRSKLYHAFFSDDIAVIEQCFYKIINQTYATPQGYSSPLYDAAWKNRVDVVDYYIAKGANIDFVPAMGCTPLHMACRNNNIDIVIRLVAEGAKPTFETEHGTPIGEAIHRGYLDIVKILIPCTNLTYEDHKRNTCFCSATYSRGEMLHFMFDLCTDINHINNDGWSYLDFAVQNRNIEAIKLLLDRNINRNIKVKADPDILKLF